MPLGSHLRELRNRLVWSAVAVLLGAVAGWLLFDLVFGLLTVPLTEAAREAGREDDITTNIGSVTGAFDLKVKVSIFTGLLVSSPVWLWQLWAFVTPGLTRREKRYTVGFVVAAVPLFLSGVALAYVALPRAVSFLVDLTPEGTVNIIDTSMYIGFIMRILLAFGASFLLPVVLVALNFVGLLPARTILAAWRWVVVLAFVLAAVLTPSPEPTAMFFLAIPLCALFFLAIGVAAINDRRRRRRDERDGYAGLSDDEAAPL
ncbi:twin-arginine translocase subunit TatC [uncultured Pseudokineococcus sp.]|uniref:twin-arginine translocase subunit TatC n=1 Tax=uncultured Pseudokineococcus sp. TaxID=1642928 RepID=UPI0026306517|nr:twin-arginine translocase subunit TatC [uncultured Pseudokineococcus sp.]